jgi:hypothetical protein
MVPYPPGEIRLQEIVNHLNEEMVEAIAADVRRDLADHVETGELIASVQSETVGQSGRVWIGTDHWQFVEYGTEPHVIMARGGIYAYALRNRAKNFYRYPGIVHHPGNAEYAPMRRALYRHRGRHGGAAGPSLFFGGSG